MDPVLLFLLFFVLRNEMHTELLVTIRPLDLQKDCLKHKVDKTQQSYSTVFRQTGKKKRDCKIISKH